MKIPALLRNRGRVISSKRGNAHAATIIQVDTLENTRVMFPVHGHCCPLIIDWVVCKVMNETCILEVDTRWT